MQEWPRCNNLGSLSSHLDEWVECLQTHGTELFNAPSILRTMLLGVIPTEFEDELLSKPHLKGWQDIIEWCKVKTVYKRQKLLAEAARKPGGSRVNSLLAETQEQDRLAETEPLDPTPAESAETPAWFKEYVCKLGVPPPPKPLT